MFQVRDLTIFQASPNARRSFQLLRRLDFVVNLLLGTLFGLCIWNVIVLIRIRATTNQDFVDILNITDHPSTWLIWLASAVTVAVIGFREYRYGERSAGLLYPATAILFVLLVPAMMTELQPVLEQQVLRVVRSECPPKNVVNGEVRIPRLCEPVPIDEGEIQLALANPLEREVTLAPLQRQAQNTAIWTVEGRGTYTVYFMIRQPDMATCEHAVLFNQYVGFDASRKNACIDWNDAVWLVIPHTTSANSISTVPLVSVP